MKFQMGKIRMIIIISHYCYYYAKNKKYFNNTTYFIKLGSSYLHNATLAEGTFTSYRRIFDWTNIKTNKTEKETFENNNQS